MNHISNYDLKGHVKDIVIEEVEYNYSKTDSSVSKDEYYSRLKFNAEGYITHEYWDKDYLRQENVYLKDSLLQYRIEYNRWFNSKTNKEVIGTYEEKYTYGEQNKILTKYIKSSHQDEFFINEKYFYDDRGYLIKKLDLNNEIHIETGRFITCKGDGTFQNDYVSFYNYDEKGERVLDSFLYDRHDVGGGEIKTLQSDYIKNFKPFKNINYHYDGNTTSAVTLHSGVPEDWKNVTINTIRDNKNRVIEKKITRRNGNVTGYFYEYHEKNGKLTHEVGGNITYAAGVNTLLKQLNYIKIYKDSKLEEIRHYKNNSEIDYIQYYNDFGDEVSRKYEWQVPYDDEYISKTNFIYDEHGNWTKKEVIESGNVISITSRDITYY